jgi:hypothetical protein
VNTGLRQRAHGEGRDGQKRIGSNYDESKRVTKATTSQRKWNERIYANSKSQINSTAREGSIFIYQTFVQSMSRYM